MQISIHGVSLDVELKTEKGRVSPLQYQKIAQMQQGGCMALILRPSDFEEFKKLVRRIKRQEKGRNRANELFAGWML